MHQTISGAIHKNKTINRKEIQESILAIEHDVKKPIDSCVYSNLSFINEPNPIKVIRFHEELVI